MFKNKLTGYPDFVRKEKQKQKEIDEELRGEWEADQMMEGKDIGKFSPDNYWIHKQKAWGRLRKGHPFDIKSKMKRRLR